MAWTGEMVTVRADVPYGKERKRFGMGTHVYSQTLILMPGEHAATASAVVETAWSLWTHANDDTKKAALERSGYDLTVFMDDYGDEWEDVDGANMLELLDKTDVSSVTHVVEMLSREGWETLAHDPNVTTCYVLDAQGNPTDDVALPKADRAAFVAARELEEQWRRYFDLMERGAINPFPWSLPDNCGGGY